MSAYMLCSRNALVVDALVKRRISRQRSRDPDWATGQAHVLLITLSYHRRSDSAVAKKLGLNANERKYDNCVV